MPWGLATAVLSFAPIKNCNLPPILSTLVSGDLIIKRERRCFEQARLVEDKLRGLGLPNPIIDDLDSKLSKFELQFWSDLKSEDEIVWYRIVSISFFFL